MRVGIDFGTTNSGVGLFDGERLQVLPVDPGSKDAGVVRTLLYITRDDLAFVGQAAIDAYYEQNIGRARRMVREVVGEILVVAAEIPAHLREVHVLVDELLPGRLFQSLKSGLKEAAFTGTRVFGKTYSLEELIAIYLRQLRERTGELLNREITSVVLGRPVNFGADPALNTLAQGRLRSAAELAGRQAGNEHASFERRGVRNFDGFRVKRGRRPRRRPIQSVANLGVWPVGRERHRDGGREFPSRRRDLRASHAIGAQGDG